PAPQMSQGDQREPGIWRESLDAQGSMTVQPSVKRSRDAREGYMMRSDAILLDSRQSICRRTWLSVFVVLVFFCVSGATCCRQFWIPMHDYGIPAPQVLSATPTLDDVISAVNANSGRVQSYVTHNASIHVPGTPSLPSLGGSIAMERPNRFRLRAGTALLGQEIDLGSNEELYWLWIKRSQPPAVYVGRHDRFGQSQAHQIMPMDPDWLLAAFGLVEFNPADHHEGPMPRSDGKLEIRSIQNLASGQVTKVTVIDATRAWVLEQHVYAPTGTLLASVIARSHRYYPADQVSLPQRVEIHLPPAQLDLSMDVGTVLINQISGDPNQLWGLPQFDAPTISLDTMGGSSPQPMPGTTNPVPPDSGYPQPKGSWIPSGQPLDATPTIPKTTLPGRQSIPSIPAGRWHSG
ncbi:MAG: hypothetical protein JW829_03655, partial [Pirellulales bacterium]|nr:hypothetical protein [Pirellulales bacterium]